MTTPHSRSAEAASSFWACTTTAGPSESVRRCRHASERRWRRSTRAGRTYYHDSDVRRTLDRAGRGATTG
ncbi:hypothetical protein [Streptomyces sp. NPDC058665]|uniref:hypothetical protein n=1 Tax=Streptomyces sp. NPDC058665 TaxID=3346586 RepID=UPI00365E89F8